MFDAAAWQNAWGALSPAIADGRASALPLPPSGARARRRLALVLTACWQPAAEAAPLSAAAAAVWGGALTRMLALFVLLAGRPGRWRGRGASCLARALAGSDVLWLQFAQHPQGAENILCGRPMSPPATTLRGELRRLRAGSADEVAYAEGLRRWVAAHWAHIVCRLVGSRGGGVARMRELSCLAEAVVEAAVTWVRRRAGGRVRLAVWAQGKLGAHELNVSSDLDLQFFYAPAAAAPPAAGRAGHPAASIAVAGAVHRSSEAGDENERSLADAHAMTRHVVALIGDHPKCGPCYRIDLDLRPEGKRGALVNTVAGAEHYYETWGQSWERLALLRARHVGGSAWLSAEVLADLRPFMAPRSLDHRLIGEIRELRGRLASEQQAGLWARHAPEEIDVKRDAGGIREVELFVQTYQVLYGGRRPSLLTPSLLAALRALATHGLVPAPACRRLRGAYLFLRRVENFLQARQGRQTHRLPRDADARARLAAWLGLASDAALVKKIRRAMAGVRRLTAELFGRPQHGGAGERAARALLRAEGDGRARALLRLGFVDPRDADAQLTALARHTGGPFCAHAPEFVRSLGPKLLLCMAHSPDPARALRMWGQLDPLLCRHPIYLRMLHDRPVVRRRLMRLAGASRHLGHIIIAYPELIDALGRRSSGAHLRQPEALALALSARLATASAHGPPPPPGEIGGAPTVTSDDRLGASMRQICRFKLTCQLHIGLDDLAGKLSVEALQARLSALAEACVQTTWRLACQPGGGAAGLAAGGPMVVLAMGRLGAKEMGFGSDLDLVFVVDDRAPAAPTLPDAVRAAQRFIRLITAQTGEGVCYPIDLRLRPSGAQGPLVTTASSMRRHFAGQAAVWEKQALLRARPVAGDMSAGLRLLGELLPPPRWREGEPAACLAAVVGMRQHLLEVNLPPAGSTDIRFGAGGLADIEFLAQGLQLEHIGQVRSGPSGQTLSALMALVQAGVLRRRAALLLSEGWRQLRRVEHVLRMVDDRPTSRLPGAGVVLAAVARRLGQPQTTALQRAVKRTMARTRRVYLAHTRPRSQHGEQDQ